MRIIRVMTTFSEVTFLLAWERVTDTYLLRYYKFYVNQ